MSGIPNRYRREASVGRDDSESDGEKAIRLQTLTVPKPYRRDLTKLAGPGHDADIDDDDEDYAEEIDSEEEHQRQLRSIESTGYLQTPKSKKKDTADDRIQYMSGIPKPYRRAASPSLTAPSPSLAAPSPMPDRNQNAASDTDSEHRRLRKGRKRKSVATAKGNPNQGKTGTSEKKPVYTDSDSDYARLREGLVDLGPAPNDAQDWGGIGILMPIPDRAFTIIPKKIEADKTADTSADIGRGHRSRRGRQVPEGGVVTPGASISRRGGKSIGEKKNTPSSFTSGRQPPRQGKEPGRTTLPIDNTTIHVPAADANPDLSDNDTSSHITVEDLREISNMGAAADAAGRKAAKAVATIDLNSPGAEGPVETTITAAEASRHPAEPVKTAPATVGLPSPSAVNPVETGPATVDADETVSEHEDEAPAPARNGEGRAATPLLSAAPGPANPPTELSVGPWTIYGNRHNPNLRAGPLPAEIPSRAAEPEEWEDGPGQKADEAAFFAKVKRNRRGG